MDIKYPEGSNVALVDGEVVPLGVKQVTPGQILEQLKAVVALPYLGTDADKIGMTLIEAALFAAAKKAADGDTDALTKLLDRICGKPLQQVANLNANITLKEFLDGIARTEGKDVDGGTDRTDGSPEVVVDPFSD